MAVYAEFFHADAAGGLHVACGDRSVVRLDERLSRCNLIAQAASECHRQGYNGYRLIKGDRLLVAAPASSIERA